MSVLLPLKRDVRRRLRKTRRFLTDPVWRSRRLEVARDVRLTVEEVGDWAGAPVPSKQTGGQFVIVSFTNLPLHAKFQCVVAKAMQLEGLTPVVLTQSGLDFGHRFFRLFGVEDLVMWDRFVEEHGISNSDADDVVESLLPLSGTVRNFMAIQFQGVDVGRHALSQTSRRRLEGSLDVTDPVTLAGFRRELHRAVRSVTATEVFLKQRRVDKMLVRDPGYIPNGPIYETALEQGTDCIIYDQGRRRHTWVLKRYSRERKREHFFSLSPSTWEKAKLREWSTDDDRRLESEFATRYAPSSQEDTLRVVSETKIRTADQIRRGLGLDPTKKTGLICSHIAWDANFFFGSCLFADFEDWLFQTVRFVAAGCSQMNWIVKLHPFNVFKLQREKQQEESEMRLLRQLEPLPAHVRLLRADTDINTWSLFPVTDYVLTVNGTVGMEFPCFGKPALLAGTGRYNGRGFTIDPGSVEEYFDLLRHLDAVPPLDKEARRLARIHFATVMNGRQVSFEDVAPMELKRVHEAQSNVHDNLRIRSKDLDEFSSASSIRSLRDWMVKSDDPDLIQ